MPACQERNLHCDVHVAAENKHTLPPFGSLDSLSIAMAFSRVIPIKKELSLPQVIHNRCCSEVVLSTILRPRLLLLPLLLMSTIFTTGTSVICNLKKFVILCTFYKFQMLTFLNNIGPTLESSLRLAQHLYKK